MKRRLLASLLTLVMMLNLLPTVAWARNDEGIDADSVEMYSSDDVVTSGPITLWTGKEGQITVPEENEVRSSNADIVSVEQDGTAVTLTVAAKRDAQRSLRESLPGSFITTPAKRSITIYTRCSTGKQSP